MLDATRGLVAEVIEINLAFFSYRLGELVLGKELLPTNAPEADLVDVFKRLDDVEGSLPMVTFTSMLGDSGLKDDAINDVSELDSPLHFRLELSDDASSFHAERAVALVGLFGLLCCWADTNSGKPELHLGTFQFVSSSSSGDIRTHIALIHHLDRADIDSV